MTASRAGSSFQQEKCMSLTHTAISRDLLSVFLWPPELKNLRGQLVQSHNQSQLNSPLRSSPSTRRPLVSHPSLSTHSMPPFSLGFTPSNVPDVEDFVNILIIAGQVVHSHWRFYARAENCCLRPPLRSWCKISEPRVRISASEGAPLVYPQWG